MRFLCFICVEQAALDALPDTEMQDLINSSLDYDEVLLQIGRFVAGQPLERVEKARTVRVRKGKLAITDGPFAETKEQLLGFLMIDAASLTEAVELVAKMPVARIGSIEVRPMRELRRGSVRIN